MGQQPQVPDYAKLAEQFGGTVVSEATPPSQATSPQAPTERGGFAGYNAINDLLAGFARTVLPSTTPSDYVEGPLYAMQHPIDSVSLLLNAIKDAHVAQGQKAMQAGREGRYSEMVGHGLAAAVPLIGPAAANAGERIGEGTVEGVAGGLGEMGGLLAGPRVMAKAPGMVGRGLEGMRAPVADMLAEGATKRMAGVMSPRVGANKTRFGNMAKDVAPQIARDPELGAISRDSLASGVSARLEEAQTGLDNAANARLSARTFKTQPLLDALLEKRRKLTAESVEGSGVKQGALEIDGNPMAITWNEPTGPLGGDVVPGPNADRVAVIDRAIQEIQRLGPSARYEPLRRIREAYDGPAKAVYSPSMTADYMKVQGEKLGAADVTGTLREALAGFDPETAAANQNYHLYRTANDVLTAAQETERVRPNLFRKTMGRVAGAAAGGTSGGGLGAVVGVVIADALNAVADSGLTTKVYTARLMTQLEDALRGNRTTQAQSLIAKLKRVAQTTEQASYTAGRTQTAAEAR